MKLGPRRPLLPSGPDASLEELRAFAPSVLVEDDGTSRLWYSGHDGSTGRILEAVQPPGRPWERLGISVDAGLAGTSDLYGVESPSVVATPEGYRMVYAGSDGLETQLHMATSVDGHAWVPEGTFMDRDDADAVGATHPSLVLSGDDWWLFYSGYDGTGNGRRASILAAISSSGEKWDRLGPVLEPQGAELAVSEPWIVAFHRRFSMFYVSDGDQEPAGSAIHLATSEDGVSWARRGVTLEGSPGTGDGLAVRSPCVARLPDGTLRLWYAGRPNGDVTAGYRLWSVDFLAEV